MDKIKGFEIIEQFLDFWKEESKKWYSEQLVAYEKAKEEYKKRHEELDNILYHSGEEKQIEVLKEYGIFYDEEKGWKEPNVYYRERWCKNTHNAFVCCIMNPEYEKFHNSWKHIEKHLGKKISFEESVELILQKEYERKYEKFVTDVQYITGDVQKAELKIGSTSNIEGFVTGCKGKAELWSTFVWGEIQAPHFRFYCHKR